MTKTSLEEIIDETAKLGGERPSLSRMQAQLDRIEAALARIEKKLGSAEIVHAEDVPLTYSRMAATLQTDADDAPSPGGSGATQQGGMR